MKMIMVISSCMMPKEVDKELGLILDLVLDLDMVTYCNAVCCAYIHILWR